MESFPQQPNVKSQITVRETIINDLQDLRTFASRLHGRIASINMKIGVLPSTEQATPDPANEKAETFIQAMHHETALLRKHLNSISAYVAKLEEF